MATSTNASLPTSMSPHQFIWLEASNLKFTATATATTIQVQLRGEQYEGVKPWWTVQNSEPDVVKNLTKVLGDALDKRRKVLAKLTFSGDGVRVTELAVQYAEAEGR